MTINVKCINTVVINLQNFDIEFFDVTKWIKDFDTRNSDTANKLIFIFINRKHHLCKKVKLKSRKIHIHKKHFLNSLHLFDKLLICMFFTKLIFYFKVLSVVYCHIVDRHINLVLHFYKKSISLLCLKYC